jgi:hypothetical protein
LLCGEWFKQRRKSGVGYEDMLTLDTFRPRYISQPWGLVNFFLPIAADKQQTECILAYMLPHGVPIFPRYLDKETALAVMTIMMEFNTRTAQFTPPWQEGGLKIEGKPNENILVATWERDGKILAVLSNLTRKPVSISVKCVNNPAATIVQRYPVDASRTRAAVNGGAAKVEIGANSFGLFLIEPSVTSQ